MALHEIYTGEKYYTDEAGLLSIMPWQGDKQFVRYYYRVWYQGIWVTDY